jgi:hypothetical protein
VIGGKYAGRGFFVPTDLKLLRLGFLLFVGMKSTLSDCGTRGTPVVPPMISQKTFLAPAKRSTAPVVEQ